MYRLFAFRWIGSIGRIRIGNFRTNRFDITYRVWVFSKVTIATWLYRFNVLTGVWKDRYVNVCVWFRGINDLYCICVNWFKTSCDVSAIRVDCFFAVGLGSTLVRGPSKRFYYVYSAVVGFGFFDFCRYAVSPIRPRSISNFFCVGFGTRLLNNCTFVFGIVNWYRGQYFALDVNYGTRWYRWQWRWGSFRGCVILFVVYCGVELVGHPGVKGAKSLVGGALLFGGRGHYFIYFSKSFYFGLCLGPLFDSWAVAGRPLGGAGGANGAIYDVKGWVSLPGG